MELKIAENAMDSLEFAKKFYISYINLGDEKYSVDRIPGYLKMATIAFHHCIELFNKMLIMQRNVDDVLEEEYKACYREKRRETENKKAVFWEANVLFSSELHDFKMIKYSDTVAYLYKYLGLNSKQKKVLMELARYRNRLTHFGLHKPIEFFEVIRVINDTIEIINDYYFENIIEVDRSIKLHQKEAFEELEDLHEDGIWIEVESWENAYADNFENINYIFQSLKDDDFLKILNEKGYKIEVELGDYSSLAYICVKIFNGEDKVVQVMETRNLSRHNATIFSEVNQYGVNENIILAIDHMKMSLEEDKDCYIYSNFKTEFDSECEAAFWETDSTRKVKKCAKMKFDEKVLQQQILNYLKKRYRV